MAANAKAEPLSIEALLQKQKAEKDAAAKVCLRARFSRVTHLLSVCSLNFSPGRNVPRLRFPNGLLSSRSNGSAKRKRDMIEMRSSERQRWCVNGREKRNVEHDMVARLVVSSVLPQHIARRLTV